MGTRNLTMVYLDGDYKVAQYGQWDGYPSGQGVTVLQFLRDKMVRPIFEKKLRELSWISEDELRATWVGLGANPNESFVSFDIADKHTACYPQLSRDTGAGVLDLIYDSLEPIKLSDERSFANDSLFCEWAYVIDLDKNMLEIYEGFNKTPLTPEDRFFDEHAEPKEVSGNTYYGIKKIGEIPLASYPTDDEFVKMFSGKDED